jgi:hypothetical protein
MVGLSSSSFSLKSVSRLFDAIALPSATYGSQILFCSPSKIKEFDVVARRFFKSALRCSISTPSVVFFFEFKLLPFRFYFDISALIFFWRIAHLPETHLLSSFPLCESAWYRRCLELLNRYHISLSLVYKLSKVGWSNLVRSRVFSCCLDEAHDACRDSILVSSGFYLLKRAPGLDAYTSSPDGYTSRIIFKLRSGANFLSGHLLRYLNIARDDRICPICGSGCEDSFHFLSVCPRLAPVRSEFINGVLSLSDRLPDDSRFLARSVLTRLSLLDLTRLLVCSFESLSTFFKCGDWFSRIEGDVMLLAISFVKKLHLLRLELLYDRNI